MSSRFPTTTSYAVLGLLSIQPWSTYDLATVMRRSLHYFWPRAESNLYAEPKRLVEARWAEAHEEWNGDRKRTVYSITDVGRGALEEWLATPPASQRLESEPYLRILYGNRGTKEHLLAAIERIHDDAEEVVAHFTRIGGEYARGEGAFPERIHVNALIATLALEQARASARWAQWAHAEVAKWEQTAVADVDWSVRTLLVAISTEIPTDAP